VNKTDFNPIFLTRLKEFGATFWREGMVNDVWFTIPILWASHARALANFYGYKTELYRVNSTSHFSLLVWKD